MREREGEKERNPYTNFQTLYLLYFALACCNEREREREREKERDPYTNFQTLPGRQTTYLKDTNKSEHTY
jgi:hypothetical protein